jgi:hypothetical protein
MHRFKILCKFLLPLPLLLILAFQLSEPDLPINQYQWIGSHNSYKEYIDPNLIKMMEKVDTSKAFLGLEYHHVALSAQLSLGLRALEIDVYADAKGGKYAHPNGLVWAGKSPARPYDPQGLMQAPGFKVLHIQDIDFRSNCLTLKNGLQELKQWSDAHPDHDLICITLNAKDDTIARPGFAPPEKFTAAVFDQLDQAIKDGLGAEKLLTPDQIRGNNTSLEAAVLQKGWPKRSKAKGKFMFILDENDEKTGCYIQNHPALLGRVCFANAPVGTPEASFLILNDPVEDGAKIREYVQKGYLVRTRADADTREARNNDYSRFKAAQANGAQIISTDYYFKSTLFPSEYWIRFEEGGYYRVR